MRKYLTSFVVVPWETPIRLSVIVTLAPASAAPEVSRAVLSMPLENLANAGNPFGTNRNRNNGKNLFRFLGTVHDVFLAANAQIVMVDLHGAMICPRTLKPRNNQFPSRRDSTLTVSDQKRLDL
jgi:hypothetical protein